MADEKLFPVGLSDYLFFGQKNAKLSNRLLLLFGKKTCLVLMHWASV